MKFSIIAVTALAAVAQAAPFSFPDKKHHWTNSTVTNSTGLPHWKPFSPFHV